ncbi:hypothetical protein [uncultured Roseobacter sp.]|uniref:hypothetical protein n=1 Tax=uncultured Roseobacter sp. TaxID=114847 RepID=UPI002633A93D|nr:hypothetical protein [uncultured Roseobacter sp.]
MEIHTITWRNIEIEITYTPDKFGLVDHIELHFDKRLSLPVSDTGYRSNFIPIGTIKAQGGAVQFVTKWLDREVKRTGWNGAQMSLF